MSKTLDAVVVGAGFAGLAMLHRLREKGFAARVFEAGSGVGGTWFWNRYPGARCDVPSMEYSFQFSAELEQEWEWSEQYSPQSEILRYLNHVADRFDLRRDIQLETRVTAAVFDEASQRWMVETDRGDRVAARYCIMATGCLSSANRPAFAGLDSFRGETFHTGNWPHEPVDLTGKRVGVIGTGSSAIQLIPVVAEQAAELYVFQRTPAYTVPARNRPLAGEDQERIKAEYPALRRRVAKLPLGWDTLPNEKLASEATEKERRAEYERRWELGGLKFYGAFADLLFDRAANQTAADYLREKIREIVADPETAEKLTPRQTFGCKRICADSGYYETFNRPNVTLVDVAAAPIESLFERGLRTTDGEYELDAIVFATGFDAMTGALSRIDVRGRGGEPLARKWAEGPKTYLGVGIAGFPNLLVITGPGSPSVLSNMVPSIEQHVNWIARLMESMRADGLTLVEPSLEAETDWVAHVNETAAATLLHSCNSWYLGANIPGKPRVFMPYLGFPQYVEKCETVAGRGYEGFVRR